MMRVWRTIALSSSSLPGELSVIEFDPEPLRAQFPALAQTVNGLPAVFFDNPGGTQVPERVIEATTR